MCFLDYCEVLFKKINRQFIYLGNGGVRGGSEGSADPPKILGPIEKKLEIEHPDPPRSKTKQSDPSM